jgi:hypothetical protein
MRHALLSYALGITALNKALFFGRQPLRTIALKRA